MDYLKVKFSSPSSILYAVGLVNLGRLSGEDIYFSSWWIRLDKKIAVTGSMSLLVDMDTD